jgi:hypothetical protein
MGQLQQLRQTKYRFLFYENGYSVGDFNGDNRVDEFS